MVLFLQMLAVILACMSYSAAGIPRRLHGKTGKMLTISSLSPTIRTSNLLMRRCWGCGRAWRLLYTKVEMRMREGKNECFRKFLACFDTPLC